MTIFMRMTIVSVTWIEPSFITWLVFEKPVSSVKEPFKSGKLIEKKLIFKVIDELSIPIVSPVLLPTGL